MFFFRICDINKNSSNNRQADFDENGKLFKDVNYLVAIIPLLIYHFGNCFQIQTF